MASRCLPKGRPTCTAETVEGAFVPGNPRFKRTLIHYQDLRCSSAMWSDEDLSDELQWFPKSPCLQKWFGRLPICFSDRDAEKHFKRLQANRRRVLLRPFVCLTSPVFVMLAVMMSVIAAGGGSGASINITAAIIFFAIASMLLTFCLRIESDGFFVAIATIVETLLIWGQSHRQAALLELLGVDSGSTRNMNSCDTDSITLLEVVALLALLCSMPGVRSTRYFFLCFVVQLVYWVGTVNLPGSFEGGSARRRSLCGSFTIVSLCFFAGRVRLEKMERLDFLRQRLLNANLTKEKVLRVQAEHEAEQGPFSSAAASSRSADNGSGKGIVQENHAVEDLASGVGSAEHETMSSIIFAPSLCNVDVQMQRINNLGTAEGWMIDEEVLKIDTKRALGSGGFGQVFSGKFHESDVAIKVSLAAEPEQRLRALVQEFRHLRSLAHPNIVTFYGACLLPESGDLVLVLEDLSSGANLVQVLARANAPSSSIDSEFRRRIILGICSALVYLHPGLVHGDLKPNNVMVSPAGNAKLIDFGLSRLAKPRAKSGGGTTMWMAPERLLKLNSASASPATDIFSFGRVMFCVVTGLAPQFSKRKDDLVKLANEGKVPPHDWPTGSHCDLQALCRSICDQCISFNPDARPTASEILCHLVPSPRPAPSHAAPSALGNILQGLRRSEQELQSSQSSQPKSSGSRMSL